MPVKSTKWNLIVINIHNIALFIEHFKGMIKHFFIGHIELNVWLKTSKSGSKRDSVRENS